MPRKRLVVEWGRGTDLQGRDYTKAAVRALSDALRRNSLTVAPALGYPRESMEVEITIGVARPEEVDREAVAATIPYGRATVDVVRGGLDVPADEGDGMTVIANASAVVWLELDDGSGGSADGATNGQARAPARGPAKGRAGEREGEGRADASGPGGAPAGARRIILESGSGADLRGEDVTRAARRAVRDALHHSSLALFGSLGIDPATMRVEIRIGVQRPDDVDLDAVAGEVPHGDVAVDARIGGLDIVDAERGTRIVVATAAVIARLPLPDGRYVLPR